MRRTPLGGMLGGRCRFHGCEGRVALRGHARRSTDVAHHRTVENGENPPPTGYPPRATGSLSLYRTRKSPSGRLSRPGSFGILEPTGPSDVALESIDLALVPGVAFDRNGGRLGHGKAYYDRFLAQSALQHLKRVGVCFDFQVVPSVPTEKHDVLMQRLIVV